MQFDWVDPEPTDPVWAHARRLGLALELLADERLDELLEAAIAFDEAPERVPRLLQSPLVGAPAASLVYQD